MREDYLTLIKRKQYLPYIIRGIAAYYYKILMKKYLHKYDVIYTVAPKIVNRMESEIGLRNMKLLTNYPIPNENYRLTKDEYLKRENVVFYEGTIYKISRQEVFLDAISRVNNIRYLVAGVIEEGYESITKHPGWKDVEFINGFKLADLPGYFSRSTISNTLRDFGGLDGSLGVIKIFESMEAALPVIFSDVPIYRDIVEKYKCGICVDPNNSDEIEKAIRFLVDNKEAAYEMGQNGRKAVLEVFNWWNQLEIYYQNLYN